MRISELPGFRPHPRFRDRDVGAESTTFRFVDDFANALVVQPGETLYGWGVAPEEGDADCDALNRAYMQAAGADWATPQGYARVPRPCMNGTVFRSYDENPWFEPGPDYVFARARVNPDEATDDVACMLAVIAGQACRPAKSTRGGFWTHGEDVLNWRATLPVGNTNAVDGPVVTYKERPPELPGMGPSLTSARVPLLLAGVTTVLALTMTLVTHGVHKHVAQYQTRLPRAALR